MKTKKSYLAFFLAIIMILTCFPSVAYSEDLSSSLGTESSQSNESSNEISYKTQVYTEDTVIGSVQEILSLREENVKHFRLDNGTYEAVVYGEAVHRKGKNGEWTDIDNSLYISGEKSSQAYSTADSRVSFASSFKSGAEIFALRENGYAISMALLSQEKQLSENSSIISATVVNSKERATDNFNSIEEARKINNTTTIVYNDIRQGINLEYALQGNDIKENIIIYKPGSNYSYSFEINLTGLKATLDRSGNIVITDSKTGKNKYYIPAPFMYDSENVYSYDVKYELQALSDGKYLLTVDANADWINDSQRAFPVTIDPTLKYYSNINDTFTYSAEPNANYGNSSIMWLSNSYMPFIQIDIPNIPEGATLSKARLLVYYYYYDNMTSGRLLGGLYPVLGQWNESTLTYNNSPNVSSTYIDRVIFSASSGAYESTPGEKIFDITSYVNDYYNGNVSYYGFALKRIENSSATNESVILKSSESGTTYSPCISITYVHTIPDGVYAFNNMYGTSYWMTVGENGAFAGANLQYMTSSVSPASSTIEHNNESLFKISKKGETYIIRSMLNNKLSFGISGNQIVTKIIATLDDDVPLEDTFNIEWDGQGFVISPYGSTSCIAIQNTSNTNLTTVPKTQDSKLRWSLSQYTGNHQSCSIIFFPSSWSSVGIVNGAEDEATLVGWSTHIDANTIDIEVKNGYSSLGEISEWNPSNGKLTLKALNPGKILLEQTTLYSDGTVVYSGDYYFIIVPQEGTYYIRNVGTKRYIDLESASSSIGANIQQWQFHTENQEKWVIEHVPGQGGYVRLKSVCSNLYIGIDISNNLLIKQCEENDYSLWMIDRSNNGNLIFTNKMTINSGNALSVPLDVNLNGTNLIQVAYTNDTNYRDEWEIHKLNYFAVVNNYYDNGYNVRYGESEEVSRQRINDYNNSVAEMYMRKLGLSIQFVSAVYYRSPIDICKGNVTSDNITRECSHNEPIHTDRSNVISAFNQMFLGNSTTTNVLWSCHDIKSIAANGQPNFNRSCSYDSSIFILEICTVTNRTINSTGILMHELNHQYGAKDHYHELDKQGVCIHSDICSTCNDNGRDDTCIMNTSRIDITQDTVICDDCINDIYIHLNLDHQY